MEIVACIGKCDNNTVADILCAKTMATDSIPDNSGMTANSGNPLTVNTLMRIDLHCGNTPD